MGVAARVRAPAAPRQPGGSRSSSEMHVYPCRFSGRLKSCLNGHGTRDTRCRSLQKGWGWGKGLAEERRASAEGGPPPISPSERHVPREPAGCAKPIMIASERELREVKRCWRIIGARSCGYGRIPKRTIYSEIVPDHKSLRTAPTRASTRGKSFLIVSSTDRESHSRSPTTE